MHALIKKIFVLSKMATPRNCIFYSPSYSVTIHGSHRCPVAFNVYTMAPTTLPQGASEKGVYVSGKGGPRPFYPLVIQVVWQAGQVRQ